MNPPILINPTLTKVKYLGDSVYAANHDGAKVVFLNNGERNGPFIIAKSPIFLEPFVAKQLADFLLS